MKLGGARAPSRRCCAASPSPHLENLDAQARHAFAFSIAVVTSFVVANVTAFDAENLDMSERLTYIKYVDLIYSVPSKHLMLFAFSEVLTS